MRLSELFNVQDYGVIVTGGASGIGLAFVEALAEHGAHVTMLDRDGAALDTQSARMCALSWDVRGVKAIDAVWRLSGSIGQATAT